MMPAHPSKIVTIIPIASTFNFTDFSRRFSPLVNIFPGITSQERRRGATLQRQIARP
jgi:hypothetical protein